MTKRIENEDWSEARLRNINLSRAKGVELNLDHADLSGHIGGLKVNGIEIAPLIHAEQERRHPERKKLFATEPDGFPEALSVLEEQLDQTWQRARKLTEEQRNQRVDEEWSTVETIRHLVFVIDGWISGTVLGQKDTHHPIGLPPTFMPAKPPGTAIDPDVRPTFEEALEIWRGRFDVLRGVVEGVTPEELERPIPQPHAKTVLGALWIVLDEIWAHNQFMNRDLAVIENGS
jgi:hypothetical protein